jgi:hypothetical protein
MRKFEVGKIYMDTDSVELGTARPYVEIEVVKRTEKTIFFKYTERSLTQSEKAERKKITKSYLEYEVIDFDCCPSAPQIAA